MFGGFIRNTTFKNLPIFKPPDKDITVYCQPSSVNFWEESSSAPALHAFRQLRFANISICIFKLDARSTQDDLFMKKKWLVPRGHGQTSYTFEGGNIQCCSQWPPGENITGFIQKVQWSNSHCGVWWSYRHSYYTFSSTKYLASAKAFKNTIIMKKEAKIYFCYSRSQLTSTEIFLSSQPSSLRLI